MSSFVVRKVEFVKMAGLMCGIESAKRFPHNYFIGVCRDMFDRAYELNVKSVNWQYGEDRLPEVAEYDSIFSDYVEKGRRAYRHGLDELRPKLLNFLSSVMYQIENEECSKEVSSWFYTCIQKLFDRETRNINGWWGEIEC